MEHIVGGSPQDTATGIVTFTSNDGRWLSQQPTFEAQLDRLAPQDLSDQQENTGADSTVSGPTDRLARTYRPSWCR